MYSTFPIATLFVCARSRLAVSSAQHMHQLKPAPTLATDSYQNIYLTMWCLLALEQALSYWKIMIKNTVLQ